MPLLGIGPYDVSKACADLLAQTYIRIYKLPLVVTRCGNIFGEGDVNPHRLIPEAIQAIGTGAKLKVRSDGKAGRDYIYVKDVVAAYLLITEALLSKKIDAQVFNVSSGNALTVLDVIKLIGKVMKKTPHYTILNSAEYEIARQTLDIAKIRKILGWSPQYSMERGLKRTAQWYTR